VAPVRHSTKRSPNATGVDPTQPALADIVYVVDDDDAVRAALQSLFESHKLAVACFRSAVDFLRYPRSDVSACLVLDLQMPGINGLELQRQLTEELTPPIVFISGRGDIPSTVKAIRGGAIEFLTKPLNPDALLAAVNAAFAKDRSVRESRAELCELKKRFTLLSPRERDVFPLIVEGFLNKEAAAILQIAEVTLQVHRSQIMRKMGAASFADLIRMATKLGIPPTTA